MGAAAKVGPADACPGTLSKVIDGAAPSLYAYTTADVWVWPLSQPAVLMPLDLCWSSSISALGRAAHLGTPTLLGRLLLALPDVSCDAGLSLRT